MYIRWHSHSGHSSRKASIPIQEFSFRLLFRLLLASVLFSSLGGCLVDLLFTRSQPTSLAFLSLSVDSSLSPSRFPSLSPSLSPAWTTFTSQLRRSNYLSLRSFDCSLKRAK